MGLREFVSRFFLFVVFVFRIQNQSMSIDKYTRDFFKTVMADLSRVVGRLDRLIGMADRPRKDDEEAPRAEGAPTQKDYAAIGKIFFRHHIEPSPPQKEQPKTKWYRTLDGWKKVVELIAIPFAIGYAIVTYCQWKDARHNFQVDERAWIKARQAKDIAGVYVDGVPVPWNDDAATFPVWAVTLTNAGKSVATDIESDGYFEILSSQQAPSMNFPVAHSQLSLPVLYPQDDARFEITLNQISSPRSLTKDEYDGLMNGDDYMVVFTETTYHDPFGLHWARMCHFAGAFDKSKSKSFVHGFAAKPCSDWNAVGDGPLPGNIRQ